MVGMLQIVLIPEFLLEFLRVIGKGRKDVLTAPGWPL